jgi:hypothetical protein
MRPEVRSLTKNGQAADLKSSNVTSFQAFSRANDPFLHLFSLFLKIIANHPKVPKTGAVKDSMKEI